MTEVLRFGKYEVETSNADKVLFPDSGITKGEVVEYYRRIAPVMLPHIEGRPLMLQRFPDGIGEEGFYQKEASDYFPDWLERVTVAKEGGAVTHVVCRKQADLVYLADQACITPHAWLSRVGSLDRPDRLVFDLDPSDEGSFGEVRFAARAIRGLLLDLRLTPFAQTTGSRGVHVVVPLDGREGFDEVRSFAQDVSALLVSRHPEHLTTEQYKTSRGDRVFLDTVRNSYAQTVVAPYAVRAKPGAPIATPIDWEELGRVGPQSYTLANIFRRMAQKKADPWEGMDKEARRLGPARRRLHEMR